MSLSCISGITFVCMYVYVSYLVLCLHISHRSEHHSYLSFPIPCWVGCGDGGGAKCSVSEPRQFKLFH